MDLTMEDLFANPNKYGVPTFEQFCANPDAWRKSADEALEQVDIGSVLGLKNRVEKMTYEVAGYNCKTLEEAQRVALNEGWDLRKIEYKPEIRDQGGGKCIIHVVFEPGKTHTERVVEQAVQSLLSTDGEKP